MCGPAAIAPLMIASTAMSVAAPLIQGVQQAKAASAQVKQIEEQRSTEAILASVEEARIRDAFGREIAQMRLQTTGQGLDLSSPGSLALGRRAAQEASFQAQSRRSEGVARDRELSSSARAARSRANNAILTGTFGAASNLLSGAPKAFPGLLS